MNSFAYPVAVVGGCGHVGLPLALAFASRGLKVRVYDVDQAGVDQVNAGQMPFDEPGAAEALAKVAGDGLVAGTDPAILAEAEHVIFVLGTPIDEHLNPDPESVADAIMGISEHLRDGQLIVLRSTLFPGATAKIEARLVEAGLSLDVAFCPERIAEGRAMVELFELPQIVAAHRDEVVERAAPSLRHVDRRNSGAPPRGGGAGQVVHQQLPLSQVRGGQPALQDRQRPRPRLREDPRRAHLSLPPAPPICLPPVSPQGRAC